MRKPSDPRNLPRPPDILTRAPRTILTPPHSPNRHPALHPHTTPNHTPTLRPPVQPPRATIRHRSVTQPTPPSNPTTKRQGQSAPPPPSNCPNPATQPRATLRKSRHEDGRPEHVPSRLKYQHTIRSEVSSTMRLISSFINKIQSG